MQKLSERAKIHNRVKEIIDNSTEIFFYIVEDEFNNLKQFSDFDKAADYFANLPSQLGGKFNLFLYFPEIDISPIGTSIKYLLNNQVQLEDAKNSLWSNYNQRLFNKLIDEEKKPQEMSVKNL